METMSISRIAGMAMRSQDDQNNNNNKMNKLTNERKQMWFAGNGGATTATHTSNSSNNSKEQSVALVVCVLFIFTFLHSCFNCSASSDRIQFKAITNVRHTYYVLISGLFVACTVSTFCPSNHQTHRCFRKKKRKKNMYTAPQRTVHVFPQNKI